HSHLHLTLTTQINSSLITTSNLFTLFHLLIHYHQLFTMQAKFIIAALGAATVGFASPVPGLFSHLACGNLLSNIETNLKAAMADTQLANSGSPPANAVTFLQGLEDTVDKNWEVRNSATKGIPQAELATAQNTIDQVVTLLNGTDPASVLANKDATTLSVQFQQIATTCEINNGDD
ncbi:hypothetical protein LZ31DRAFT_377671, partial [Colletotrichum somersetense]